MDVQGSRRAGTLVALASVTAVAVVVAGGLVGWIRISSPGVAELPPSGPVEEVPEVFGGGFAPAPVPAAVAGAVDAPVVGVVVLDEAPDDADVCGLHGAGEDRELVWALVTPDGMQLAFLSDEPPWHEEPRMAQGMGAATPEPEWRDERFLESCVVKWEQGRWVGHGGMGMSVPADGPIPADGGSGSSCCDRQGFATASTHVAPVAGATWLLQDRGRYWLAYPVEGFDVVPLTWRFQQNRFGNEVRMPATHVLSVDADGTVLDDRYISG